MQEVLDKYILLVYIDISNNYYYYLRVNKTFVLLQRKGSRHRTVPSGTILRGLWKNGTFLTENPVLMLWFPPDGLTAV